MRISCVVLKPDFADSSAPGSIPAHVPLDSVAHWYAPFFGSLPYLTKNSDVEIVVLRHQLKILRHQVGRADLRKSDRLFLAALSRILVRSNARPKRQSPDGPYLSICHCRPNVSASVRSPRIRRPESRVTETSSANPKPHNSHWPRSVFCCS